MADENEDGLGIHPDLRRAAEIEMRRVLPGDVTSAKRRKTGGEEEEQHVEIGRFDYGAVQELASGMSGFLLSCDFRR